MPDLMKLARAVAEAAQKGVTSTAADTPTIPAGILPAKACATCANFRAKDADGRGWCDKYRVETFGRYADGCRQGFTPADTIAREMERRRAEVAARLEADPALRYAFDVVNASPTGPAARDVSVMLAMRDAVGRIVTRELHIPADRWPGMAMFVAYWRDAGERRPS